MTRTWLLSGVESGAYPPSMSYTYIPGSSKHQSGPNGTVTRIVIHATVSSCARGGARGNARYFQSDNAGGLAHFVVDPGEVIQCCPEDIACWHAPPNHGSIGVELCDPQAGPASRWEDGNHTAMLQHAAGLVADLCIRHRIPAVKLNATDLKAGRVGLCGHGDVSQAFHESDHSDPDHAGAFPWATFLHMVQTAMKPPQHYAATPAPKPVPAVAYARPLGPVVTFGAGTSLGVWELVLDSRGSRLRHIAGPEWVARKMRVADVIHLPDTDLLTKLPKEN